MALVVQDFGDSKILSMITGRRVWNASIATGANKQGDTLCLRLYKSVSKLGVIQPLTYTPAKADTYRNYLGSNSPTTMLASNFIFLQPATWTMTTTNRGAGDTVAATYSQQTFTYSSGSGDTAQGYLVTTVASNTYSASDTILLWAEKFSDGPYVIPAGGGTIKITPKVIMN